MKRLFWVRHGPTHAKGMVGWTDIEADLSDTSRVARLSAHLPVDARIVSSDLIRAQATADAIAGARQRMAHDERFREIHFGTWEMRRFDEISAEDPDHIRAFYETPGEIAPPKGESWNDLVGRVSAATDELIDDPDPRPVVVVAHMGVILCHLQRALGVSAYKAMSHRIDPLSVTETTFDGAWRVASINHQL